MKRSILSLILFISLGLTNLYGEFVKINGIVTHTSTKLQWQDDYSDNGGTVKSATWADAINYCESSSLGGFTDWRLPNKNELLSIVDYSKYTPSIDSTFENISSSRYWSSTTDANGTNGAWYVTFGHGSSGYGDKSNTGYVRCVRAGQFENLELKKISLLSENPNDYEIKTSSFTKTWNFSEDISGFSIEVIENNYGNSISSSSFIKSGASLSLNLTPNSLNGTNKLTLKFRDSTSQTVKINGSDTFWSLTKTNHAPGFIDGQITQMAGLIGETLSLDIATYDADDDNVSLSVSNNDGGSAYFTGNTLNVSFSDSNPIHTITIALNDGKETVEKEITVLSFDSTSIQTFYSDVDVNNTYFKDIVFGTLEGVFSGQPDPNDNTKRVFRPNDAVSMAEVLKMIIQAAKKIGKIELTSSAYYLDAYPNWVKPYFTFAREVNAVNEVLDGDLSVIYPTKEEIARILVKVLKLDENPILYQNLNYTYDNQDKFSREAYKKYANITKLFGLLFTRSYEDPTLTLTRSEVAQIVSKIFMMPKATVGVPAEVDYGESFNINLDNIEAKVINSNFNLENTSNLESSFAVNTTILSSNEVNSIDMNVGDNQILTVLDNNGIRNILTSNVIVNYTVVDIDNDGINDAIDTDIGNNGINDTVEQNQSTFIERFYQNILNRSADTGGMNTWLDVIQNQSAAKVALGFFQSQEFINLGLSNEQFVDILYQTLFDRVADSGGRDIWLNQLNNGTSRIEVIYGFLNAQEFKNLADSFGVTQIRDIDQITEVPGYVNRFYNLVLNRSADEVGFNDWVSQLRAGTKAGGDIAKGFFNSQEYIQRGLDDSTFLDICYRAFFNREADIGGKNSWLSQIAQGATTDDILNGFIGSQEFIQLAASYGINP